MTFRNLVSISRDNLGELRQLSDMAEYILARVSASSEGSVYITGIKAPTDTCEDIVISFEDDGMSWRAHYCESYDSLDFWML